MDSGRPLVVYKAMQFRANTHGCPKDYSKIYMFMQAM
jgi:hypothetical protein